MNRRFFAPALVLCLLASASAAQDRLATMPGYAQHQKVAKEIPGSVKLGTLSVSWKDEGKAFEYRQDGKTLRFDVAAGKAVVPAEVEKKAPDATAPAGRGPSAGGAAPQERRRERTGDEGPPVAAPRGRQAGSALSPDGKRKAFCRGRNLWLSDADGKNEVQITAEGDEKRRIKCATGCWVYGEELNQRTAMWWSPDGKKLAYYRFDESKTPDYALAVRQTEKHSKADIESYPKPGDPNPVVDLFIYDLETKKTVQADVRDGKPFGNDSIGHYVYRIGWSPDGKELHFHRTNRLQNVLEFAAADPETGKVRVIVREEWQPSWVENHPYRRYLKDNRRFIWASERTGFRNFYLYDLSGSLLATLTDHPFEVANVVRVDEEAGLLWYMARSGDNPMKLQLHRVGLDGKGDVRLTDPAFHHTVDIAPDGKHFIDVIQTHDTPPATRLVRVADQKVVAELAKSDTSKFDQLGLKKVELFTFKAADGETELHGLLHFPSNFDPAKKWPLLVSTYNGPGTNGARETFTLPNAFTEYGFLVATLDARSAAGRGKRFMDAIYKKLGSAEIDDLAAGVKALHRRPYVDPKRVGIFGGSYGGFSSALCLLKHPDVFQAACASSPVTDYRLYDSIYTERYMGLPEENKAGYDAGSALLLASKLKGRLMLYYGTQDNNVHPSNTLQLVKALQRAGKSFELQVGPDLGHTGINQLRMMEFFIENLAMKP